MANSEVTINEILRRYYTTSDDAIERGAAIFLHRSSPHSEARIGMCQTMAYCPKGDRFFHVTVPFPTQEVHAALSTPERVVNILERCIKQLLIRWDEMAAEGEDYWTDEDET